MAESEVGWIVRLKARPNRLIDWTPRETREAAERHIQRMPTGVRDEWEIVRVRITVEPETPHVNEYVARLDALTKEEGR